MKGHPFMAEDLDSVTERDGDRLPEAQCMADAFLDGPKAVPREEREVASRLSATERRVGRQRQGLHSQTRKPRERRLVQGAYRSGQDQVKKPNPHPARPEPRIRAERYTMNRQRVIKVKCKKCGRIVNADAGEGGKVLVRRHANFRDGGWCKAHIADK